MKLWLLLSAICICLASFVSLGLGTAGLDYKTDGQCLATFAPLASTNCLITRVMQVWTTCLVSFKQLFYQKINLAYCKIGDYRFDCLIQRLACKWSNTGTHMGPLKQAFSAVAMSKTDMACWHMTTRCSTQWKLTWLHWYELGTVVLSSHTKWKHRVWKSRCWNNKTETFTFTLTLSISHLSLCSHATLLASNCLIINPAYGCQTTINVYVCA